MKKFEPGQIVLSEKVADRAAEDGEFNQLVLDCLRRHLSGDWGDLCLEDKKENEFSLDKHLRLLSTYVGAGQPPVWVVTEADRSATTVLFPDEY